MTTNRRTTLLAALSVALMLGAASACGGGGGDDSDVATLSEEDSGSEEAAADDTATDEEILGWVECMRDEGIDIADPTRDSSGNLVLGGGDSSLAGGQSVGGDPDDIDAAHEVCGQQPRLGPTDISEEEEQQTKDAALDFAQCMRDEGVEDFPDPDFSSTGPGGAPEGASPGADTEGATRSVNAPFGEIDFDDPPTKAAYETCQGLLGGISDGSGGSSGGADGPQG